jgi:hypothetical protein
VELQSSVETTTAELEENLKSLREKTSFQGGGEGEGEGEGEGAPVLRIPPVIVPVSLCMKFHKPHPMPHPFLHGGNSYCISV